MRFGHRARRTPSPLPKRSEIYRDTPQNRARPRVRSSPPLQRVGDPIPGRVFHRMPVVGTRCAQHGETVACEHCRRSSLREHRGWDRLGAANGQRATSSLARGRHKTRLGRLSAQRRKPCSSNWLRLRRIPRRPSRRSPQRLPRLSLVVTGPDVPAATTTVRLGENVDRGKTFAAVDGKNLPERRHSLLPLLEGETPPTGESWSSTAAAALSVLAPDFQLPLSGGPTTYEAMRIRESRTSSTRTGSASSTTGERILRAA